MLYLVLEELSEVTKIGLTLLGINHCHCRIKMNSLTTGSPFNSTHYIRQLTDTRRLDKDAVGMILIKYLLKSCTEITYE